MRLIAGLISSGVNSFAGDPSKGLYLYRFEACLFSVWKPSLAFLSAPIPLIWDTDMASDVGDVGAIGVLNASANSGLVTPLAVTTSVNNIYSAPCAYAFMKYSGRQSVPIGAYQGSSFAQSSLYAQTIRDNFGTAGDTRANYSDPVTVMRQALVSSAGGVVICWVGPLNNISSLLNSAGDGISSLTSK